MRVQSCNWEWGCCAGHDSHCVCAEALNESGIVLVEMQLFRECLEVGNTKLITQFQGKYYEQLHGLTMGVADSPDLANLYGLHYEDECRILLKPCVPFYGRYIDDCIGIVYANSEQEALGHLACVRFDNCVIEWNVSERSQLFLDMMLYKDAHPQSSVPNRTRHFALTECHRYR